MERLNRWASWSLVGLMAISLLGCTSEREVPPTLSPKDTASLAAQFAQAEFDQGTRTPPPVENSVEHEAYVKVRQATFELQVFSLEGSEPVGIGAGTTFLADGPYGAGFYIALHVFEDNEELLETVEFGLVISHLIDGDLVEEVITQTDIRTVLIDEENDQAQVLLTPEALDRLNIDPLSLCDRQPFEGEIVSLMSYPQVANPDDKPLGGLTRPMLTSRGVLTQTSTGQWLVIPVKNEAGESSFAVNYGSSGGPVYTNRGEVIGFIKEINSVWQQNDFLPMAQITQLNLTTKD